MKITDLHFDNSEGNYLNNAFNDNNIPTNCILAKNVTGIGATTTELNSKRHSIIIVESREIIDNKKNSTPKLFIVREGIGVDRIKKYLTSKPEYFKIMTTPESFPKLIQACKELETDIYKTFFILVDECDRIIKNADFRKSFSTIMDEFFKFKNKAMVTATFIEPSDPRLNSFTVINIIPKYHKPKAINLHLTNNSCYLLNDILISNGNKKWLVFANSNRIIRACIDKHGYNQEYSVFCGKDYKESYNGYKLKYLGTSVDVNQFSQINFFTGRYFAGLDINVIEEYSIAIISDPEITLHSTLDPLTDVVQIIGRVRNQKLIKGIHVICVNKSDIDFFTKEELLDHFTSSETDYYNVCSKKEKATSSNSIQAYNTILNKMPFASFIDESNKKSYYLLDCYTYYNSVKSYYKSNKDIYIAFKNCSLYNSDLKHYKLQVIHRDYPVFSSHLNTHKYFREVIKEIIDLIDSMKNRYINESIEFIKKHIKHFENIYSLYNSKGRDFLLKECFTNEDILEELRSEAIYKKGIIEDIKSNFKIGDFYSAKEMKSKLKNILDKHNVKEITSQVRNYHAFFKTEDLSKKIDGKTVRGYIVKSYNKRLQN